MFQAFIFLHFSFSFKKYYMIVYLVEATTVEQLVDRLKKGKYKSMEEIRTKSEHWSCLVCLV